MPAKIPGERTDRPIDTLDVPAGSVAEALDSARAPGAGGIVATRRILSPSNAADERTANASLQRPGSLPQISLGFHGADDLPPDREGKRVSDLTLRALIGEGGMGAVYLAHQRSLGREVAVKCLRAEVRHPRAIEALLREAKIGGALEHPNIVPVHALGQDEQGGPVLVMKRIEGTPWRELLDRADHAAWSPLDAQYDDRRVAHLQILVQVCNALDFAHSRGVIHRDIKPDNVMIGGFGEVYLLDWGVAIQKIVDEGDTAPRPLHVLGTPYYMAPEMVPGDERAVDERTDVYLLGATLHEILTGTYRHEGTTVEDVLLAAAVSAPVTYGTDVPTELAALCNESTQRERANRPPTVAAFRLSVTEYLRHRGSVALTNTADAAMARLHAIPGVTSLDAAALTSGDAHQQMSEARFGYLQALREWPGNERARAGLEASLAVMVDREIAQRNPDAALALLKEMASPPASLRERADALATEIAVQRERDQLAQREAKEMDSSVSSRARIAVMAASLGVSIYLAVDSMRSEIRMGHPIPMSDVLSIDGVMLAAMLIGIVLARKSLFANRISRQMTWLGLGAMGMSFASDALVWIDHGTSRTAGMHALLILSASIGIGALLLLPGLWIAAAVLLASAVLSAIFPVLTSAMVTIATAGTLIVVIHQTLKHAKKPPSRV